MKDTQSLPEAAAVGGPALVEELWVTVVAQQLPVLGREVGQTGQQVVASEGAADLIISQSINDQPSRSGRWDSGAMHTPWSRDDRSRCIA